MRNIDIMNYLLNEAEKIINKQGKAKLMDATFEFYKKVKKIETAFANQTDISNKHKRIDIIIDDYNVIGRFDFMIK